MTPHRTTKDSPSRNAIRGMLAALALCVLSVHIGSGETPPSPRFIRPAKLEFKAERTTPEDPETGNKNVRITATLTSKEHISTLENMTATLLVIGHYRPVGYTEEITEKSKKFYRMLQHQTREFQLKPGESITLDGDLITSGIGKEDHPNYGVYYMAYVYVIENAYGETCAVQSSNQIFLRRLEELRSVKAGEDFPIHP